MKKMPDMEPILNFLLCPTPEQWILEASKEKNLPILLIDHANNELKAAQNAISLLSKYRSGIEKRALDYKKSNAKYCSEKTISINAMPQLIGNSSLLYKMSRLAREELRHFEQVLSLIEKRGIEYHYISASRYAAALKEGIRKQEPERLVDTLVVGAFIEARSCERFNALAPL